MILTETCMVTPVAQRCDQCLHALTPLLWSCRTRDHSTARLFVKPQREAASASASASALASAAAAAEEEEEEDGTCALPGAVLRFCFNVTAMVETSAKTINLVKISEVRGALVPTPIACRMPPGPGAPMRTCTPRHDRFPPNPRTEGSAVRKWSMSRVHEHWESLGMESHEERATWVCAIRAVRNLAELDASSLHAAANKSGQPESVSDLFAATQQVDTKGVIR